MNWPSGIRWSVLVALALVSFIFFNNCSGFKSELLSIEAASVGVNRIYLTQSTLSDLKQIQQAVDQVQPTNAGITEIVLEPRAYNLACAEPEVQGLCLLVNGRGRIRLKGQPGKTSLNFGNPRVGGLFVNDMEFFELNGVTIDYQIPPFLQGRIVAVNGREFNVQIDDGFVEFDHPLFAKDFYASESPGSYVLNPGTRVIKGDASHWVGLSARRPVRTGAARTWSVESALPSVAPYMNVGDSYIVASRPSIGSALHLSFNRRVVVKDVTIQTAPLFALFLFGNQTEVVIDRLRIEANGTRLASTVGDAIHAQNNRAPLSVTNSYFASMGDDGVNIYAYASTVTGVASARQILVSSRNISEFRDEFRMGDRLQILARDENISRFGSAPKIVDLRREPTGAWRLTLDQDVPAQLRVTDAVFNLNQAAPGSMVRGNTFAPFRGSIRVRGEGSSFAGNSFVDARNNHILLTRIAEWPNEGPLRVSEAEAPAPEAPAPNAPTEPGPSVGQDSAVSFSKVIHRFRLPEQRSYFFRASAEAFGGVYEGGAFVLSSRTHSSLAPLYRCSMNGGLEFISRSANCEGQRLEETLGYISIAKQSGAAAALVRCHRSSGGHLTTRLASECQSPDFKQEGVLGYVP